MWKNRLGLPLRDTMRSERLALQASDVATTVRDPRFEVDLRTAQITVAALRVTESLELQVHITDSGVVFDSGERPMGVGHDT